MLSEKKRLIEKFDQYYLQPTTHPLVGRTLSLENIRLIKSLVSEGASVLDVGCGNGDILAALSPSRGVGIDCSSAAIKQALKKHPDLTFHCMDAEEKIAINEKFEYVILNNVIGDAYDIWKMFRNLRACCDASTRVISVYYNFLWEPIFKLATLLGLRKKQWEKNWFSKNDMKALFELNGFETILTGSAVFSPLNLGPVSTFLNRVVATLPIFQSVNVLTYAIAKIDPNMDLIKRKAPSVSVIIPTRNEAGNIEAAVSRTENLGSHTELIFVDGDSSDGTVEVIKEQIQKHKNVRDIRLIHQIPPNTATEKKKMLKLGKGDAVRKGFAQAKGDILMILDSDLTVPPEELNKFYLAIQEEHAEFVNGNRLSYPLEKDSMRILNKIANRIFGLLFTWLLGQPVKDTLCGTKVLSRKAYEKISANRSYFGDFDPFGDFDLLFGAAKQHLKIIDLPIRYQARTYGEIKIERFKHGLLLLRMSWIAFLRLKWKTKSRI